VQQTDSVGQTLSPENLRGLMRHVQLRDVMELGRRGKLPLQWEKREPNCPPIVDLETLYTFRPARGSPQFNDLQQRLRDWQQLYDDGVDFLPLPEINSGVSGFAEAREETFREFNDWLSCCALRVAAE